MTLKIDAFNATARRIYNCDAVQAALERAASQRKNPSRTRAQQNETIRQLGKLRGAEREAEIWITHGMGDAQAFLASISANTKRKASLFNGGPIR